MVRVVLYKPEHDINVGMCCRAMKNFGEKELFLVNPVAKIGFQARLYAKHSEDVLEKARKVSDFEQAVSGCKLVAGTTGVKERFKGDLKTCVSPREFVSKLSEKDFEETAIVFGSESTGLPLSVLNECDFIIHIPAWGEHPVLNLSHAVAVVLYEVYSKRFSESVEKSLYPLASKSDLILLEKMFRETTNAFPEIENKERVSLSFKRILRRARPSVAEAKNLLATIAPVWRMACGRKKGNELRRELK